MRKSKELFGKHPEWRTADDVRSDRDSKRAIIKGYGTCNVEMRWGWNDAVVRDQMFKLKLGDVEVILDKEEFMKSLRWV